MKRIALTLLLLASPLARASDPHVGKLSWTDGGGMVIVEGSFDGETAQKFACIRATGLCTQSWAMVIGGLLLVDGFSWHVQRWSATTIEADDGNLVINRAQRTLIQNGKVLR